MGQGTLIGIVGKLTLPLPLLSLFWEDFRFEGWVSTFQRHWNFYTCFKEQNSPYITIRSQQMDKFCQPFLPLLFFECWLVKNMASKRAIGLSCRLILHHSAYHSTACSKDRGGRPSSKCNPVHGKAQSGADIGQAHCLNYHDGWLIFKNCLRNSLEVHITPLCIEDYIQLSGNLALSVVVASNIIGKIL